MALPVAASIITDDLAHYPHVPNFYKMSNALTPQQEDAVHRAMIITPLCYAIIIDVADFDLASRFAPTVIRAVDMPTAVQAAKEFYEIENHRSVILQNQSDILLGVYTDREAPVPCS